MNRCKSVRTLLGLALVLAATGCSLFIDPDPDSLGRADSVDAGRPDSGPPVVEGIEPACESHTECDDGRYCNGSETCDPDAANADPRTGCVPGTEVTCSDGINCTEDRCDETVDRCVADANHDRCDDDVSCTEDRCEPDQAVGDSGCIHPPDHSVCDTGFCHTGGECDSTAGCVGGSERDCRDGDPCTMDFCSEEAGMCMNPARDDDGDGYPTRDAGAECVGGTDCNDFDAAIHPGAEEACNGRDDNCNGDADEGCVPTPDRCASATEITLVGGRGSARGDVASLSNDYGTLCGDSGGRDAVYYVDVDSVSDVEIDTVGSSVDTVLAVATSCSSTGWALGCDDDILPGDVPQSRLWVHRFGPSGGEDTRRLYILVDTNDDDDLGSYVVNVQVRTPASSDTCSSPLDVSAGGSLVGFIDPSLTGLLTSGTCALDLIGTQAVMSFRIAPYDEVEIQSWSNDFAPYMYVRTASCEAGEEVDCTNASHIGGGYWYADLDLEVTPGIRYFLFVDGASGGDSYFVSFKPKS